MINAVMKSTPPENEPVRPYRPGDPETQSLKAKLAEMAGQTIEIPCIIGGEEVFTGNVSESTSPHDHNIKLCRWHGATPEVVNRAVEVSQEAWREWSELTPHARLSVFMKAGELLAGPWRDTINASTMLGQSKTCHQAEIDAACELIDFYRFNPYYALTRIYTEQPTSYPGTGVWNYMDHRPLEGFVFAVTPFNFTSIAGNLPTSPAMMGNVVLWKPASSAVLSAYYLVKMFEEAGLPPGVINFVPGRGASVGDPVLASPHLAGIHFTGSTPVFQSVWKTIGGGIDRYRGYPRIVGETGGKDFIFMHESAGIAETATAIVRGGYEYQGQKCSAVSRVYVPRSRWSELKDRLLSDIASIKMGDVVGDFTNFMGAVIDRSAYRDITAYIDYAKQSPGGKIIAGGEYDDSQGFFIKPTLIECEDPKFKTMQEEIFGPVVSLHVYDESKYTESLELCNSTSEYALTGAVFARDRYAIEQAATALRHAAGNFYINDKPTGAVVSQQPFGGARASGTNDKAGSVLNLIRWISPRSVKELFAPPTEYRYPYMG